MANRTQCCFPQLSSVAREVHEQLKIDFLQALPTEISFRILSYLDAASLCRAAQVSRQWKELADDDVVWHVICSQHIDRKCARCGWKLPLLERKRLKNWSKQQDQAHKSQHEGRNANAGEAVAVRPPMLHAPNTPRSPSPVKREASSLDEALLDPASKRRRLERLESDTPSTAVLPHRPEIERSSSRPWKDVYRQSHRVSSNWKHGRGALNVIRGHTNGITALQILDDRWMATGSYDASIKIYDLQTGAEVRTLQGHTRGIRSLQFDDSKLISGSLDHTIKIWNWHTGECVSTLQCHADGVISVHFDGEFLASGSIDNTAKIFNFKTHQTFTLKGHSDWVNQVRVDSKSRTVFTASDDCVIKLWDLDTKLCIKTFEGHVGHVQQVLPLPADFEPDEELASAHKGVDNSDAASTASGRSNPPSPPANFQSPHWPANPYNQSSVRTSAPLSEEALRASYGPTFVDEPNRPLPARYILTGSLDSTVRLFDTATTHTARTFFGHLEGIWGLAGDALRIVTGANDAMVKVWEPRSGKCERTFTGHRGPVTCVALSDSRMVSGGEDGEVRVYNFGDGKGSEVEFGTPS
jgi:F-box and WD-40 domain protein MET30